MPAEGFAAGIAAEAFRFPERNEIALHGTLVDHEALGCQACVEVARGGLVGLARDQAQHADNAQRSAGDRVTLAGFGANGHDGDDPCGSRDAPA